MSEARVRARSEKSQARADAQRERILTAALQCFVDDGFHAAGMAKIAETAGMSPGLIYRYFDSKAEIIRTIVGRQLECLRGDLRMQRPRNRIEESVAHFACHTDPRYFDAHPALLLELSAEATRDPEIAAIVRHFDRQLQRELISHLTLAPDAGGLGIPQERASVASLMLQVFFEGLRVREAREPDLDRGLLRSALTEMFRSALGDAAVSDTDSSAELEAEAPPAGATRTRPA